MAQRSSLVRVSYRVPDLKLELATGCPFSHGDGTPLLANGVTPGFRLLPAFSRHDLPSCSVVFEIVRLAFEALSRLRDPGRLIT
jgi:hypothetical protein